MRGGAIRAAGAARCPARPRPRPVPARGRPDPAAFGLAAGSPGLALPGLGDVAASLYVADCPGASEVLAQALLEMGAADPAALTAATDTGAYVEASLERWGRAIVRSDQLVHHLDLRCQIDLDTYGRPPQPKLTLSLTPMPCLEWRIGPFLRELAGRSPGAARTLLAVIERQLTCEVYGPGRAKDWRDTEAEWEREMAEDEAADDEPPPAPAAALEAERHSAGGAPGSGTGTAERAEDPWSFAFLGDAQPFTAGSWRQLRPWLDPPVRDAAARLLRAEAALRRGSWPPGRNEAWGDTMALYCLYDEPGDAVVAAWDMEAETWQDPGPAYAFTCAPSAAAEIVPLFRAMGLLLAVHDALHALYLLTDAPE